MALFDLQAPPESKFLYTPPKYVQPRSWFDKMALQALGQKYDKTTNRFTGQKNTWGKIAGWISPQISLTGDAILHHQAAANNATDAEENASLDTQRDLGKFQTIVGGALAVGGAATLNPGLISSGIKLGTAGIGQVTSTPQDALKEQTATDRGTQYWFKKGGKMKTPSEDIAMIDKKTGQKIGETSYGERIFSKQNSNFMEKLANAHKHKELGKYVAKVIKKHDAKYSDEGEMKDGGMPKAPKYASGGELTPEKAGLILKDGTIRGKKITPKQQRYFGWVAGGAKESDKYFTGGTIHIKKSHEGLFRSWASKHGFNSTQEAASHVMAHKDQYDPAVVKRANFAVNFGGKKYWEGGKIKKYAAGDKIIPGIDSEEYQNWLTQHGDELKSASSDELYNQFTNEWNNNLGNDPAPPNNSPDLPSSNALSPLGFTGTPSNTSSSKLSGNDWANIADAGATGLFDIAKFITGLHGAGKTLPTWRMPEDWVNYLHKTRDMADQGFSAPERANYYNDLMRNYGMDISNINNASGGSNAFALGNEGAAINRLNAATGTMNAQDAALHRSNLGTFGDAAYKTIPFDRTLFEDKFNLDFLNKKTGAELAQQGLQGLFDTAQNFQQTAPGSLYDQMVKQQLNYYKSLNSIDWSNAYKNIGT